MTIPKIVLLCALLCVSAMWVVIAEEPLNDAESIKGKELEGYRLTVRANKQTYQPLEPVHLEITVGNVWKEAVTIGIGDTGNPFINYDINDIDITWHVEGSHDDGKTWVKEEKVPLTSEGKRIDKMQKFGSASTVRLKSGEVMSDSIPMLNRIFDMTKAGEYRVVVRRRLPKRDDVSKRVEVISNTLVIKIKE